MTSMFSDILACVPYSRSEVAAIHAKDRGCHIVLPATNELFVDLDSQDDVDLFWVQIGRLREDESVSVVIRPSPSGKEGRFHVVVTLDRDIGVLERVLLQAILGSDRVREFLSYRRYKNGDPMPTLFFEKGEPGLTACISCLVVCEVVDDKCKCCGKNRTDA